MFLSECDSYCETIFFICEDIPTKAVVLSVIDTEAKLLYYWRDHETFIKVERILDSMLQDQRHNVFPFTFPAVMLYVSLVQNFLKCVITLVESFLAPLPHESQSCLAQICSERSTTFSYREERLLMSSACWKCETWCKGLFWSCCMIENWSGTFRSAAFERGTLLVIDLGWSILMSLLHLYLTRFKYRISIPILYRVNFQVGYASETKEYYRRKHPPWRDYNHLMRYSVRVHDYHTVSLVAEWPTETTPSVDAVYLARTEPPVRMTQAKPVRIISPTAAHSKPQSPLLPAFDAFLISVVNARIGY